MNTTGESESLIQPSFRQVGLEECVNLLLVALPIAEPMLGGSGISESGKVVEPDDMASRGPMDAE